MTSRDRYGIMLPVPVFEESTGSLVLTDGTHRQVVCKIIDGLVILHWKYDHTTVRIPIEDWLKLFS